LNMYLYIINLKENKNSIQIKFMSFHVGDKGGHVSLCILKTQSKRHNRQGHAIIRY